MEFQVNILVVCSFEFVCLTLKFMYFQQEYKKLGSGFNGLANSFKTHCPSYSQPLTEAMQNTGKTYEDIGINGNYDMKGGMNPKIP